MRLTLALFGLVAFALPTTAGEFSVGFGETDLTPEVGVGKKPVYLAGFGQNRKATKIHDPLKARAVVFAHADRKVALISVDLVGLGYDSTERVRQQLRGYTYVVLSCTHNHEGPDT